MKHALIIGEALIDIVSPSSGQSTEHVGGSPANVAVGLARLGNPVKLATWFGDDVRGQAIQAHFAHDSVEIVPGSDGASRTSTAHAILDNTGAATYAFDLEWEVPEVHLDTNVQVLHVGSIGATLQPGGAAVAEIVSAAREYAIISYDPNARPSIMGSPQEAEQAIKNIVLQSDVVKVSDEDLAWLYPQLDPREVVRQWAQQGPALVIMTAGGEGSFAVTSTGIEVEVPAAATTVVDTVGAGDSYMGGVIDALWRRDLIGAENRSQLHEISETAVRAVMEWAAQIAGITVSRPGANPPTYQELMPHA